MSQQWEKSPDGCPRAPQDVMTPATETSKTLSLGVSEGKTSTLSTEGKTNIGSFQASGLEQGSCL